MDNLEKLRADSEISLISKQFFVLNILVHNYTMYIVDKLK